MTVHKEETATDVEAIQVWSAKELELEFAPMLKAYHDKETEFNWEARDKSITRLRGLLRGNAIEAPYLEVFIPGIKQLVDGIVKAVESLRTQLAVKALLLVEDLGVYVGKHLDNYTIDQILLCMMRCSSLTKKIVASASFKATNVFLKHTHFYPKIMNMLNLSMNEKNAQVRLYAIGYVKTLLQTHAHRDHTRLVMDRTNGVVDYFENILTKGLNDPTPVVKEPCREAFWIFWEHWRERGEHILRQLPAAAQKQLEKSKSKRHSPVPTSSKSLHSPTHSSRASSSLGRQQQQQHSHELSLSPTTSTTSNGSASHLDNHHHALKRSMSPQIRTSPPPPLPSSLSSHLSQSNSTTTATIPTTTNATRKTRVPTLYKKKSAVNLISKRKPSLMTLLQSDDITLRADGFMQLAKKLSTYPYTPIINLNAIMIDIPNAPPLDGETLKSMVLNQWEDNYEVLSSWDCVTNIMIKLLTFEEYIPKLILDANMDENAKRSDNDFIKHEYAILALTRAKLFLQCENFDLVDTLFTSLVHYGGFVSTSGNNNAISGMKKDITRLPANRRKLTKQFLEWMDEIVTPLIGLNDDIDYTMKAYEGVPNVYVENFIEKSANTASWFESDDNVRQCLAILLPWTTSTSGTIWYLPLITFIKHLRLLNQRLFEMVTASYDDTSINKICRALGIHIRIEPLASTVQVPIQGVEAEEMDHSTLEKDQVPSIIEEEEPEPSIVEEEPEDTAVDAQEEPELTIVNKELEDSNQNEYVQQTVSQLDVGLLDHYPDTGKISTTTEPEFDHAPAYEEDQANLNMTTQERDMASNRSVSPSTDNATKSVEHHSSYEENNSSFVPNKDGSLIQPLESDIAHNELCRDYNAINGAESLYKNQNDATIDDRTAPNACAELPQQSQDKPQQQIVSNVSPGLTPSSPNPEKYPTPKFVPFFAPEKVNYPDPVFQNNERSIVVTSNGSSTTANNRNLKDKTTLLYALIDKLKLSASDPHQTFRKLIRLCKEVPIRRRWDQGGIEESGSETWAGAKGDAGNFVELVQAIIFFLDHEQNNEKYLAVSLECIRQLAVTQAGLFRFYERKVNTKGMTLESQLMERLLLIRSNENPTICIAAEDALDSILGTLNPPTAFEMLMAFIIHRLLIAPEVEGLSDVRYHPVGSAFMYVGKWVKEMNDTFYIDEWLGKGGVNAFFKGMNHSTINIRKSCVEAIVAFYEVIGDDIYLFLVDLREDQVNLLRHYVAKALKKKASLRNPRDNGQF